MYYITVNYFSIFSNICEGRYVLETQTSIIYLLLHFIKEL